MVGVKVEVCGNDWMKGERSYDELYSNFGGRSMSSQLTSKNQAQDRCLLFADILSNKFLDCMCPLWSVHVKRDKSGERRTQ